jgi:salicylate hydroxylase
VAGITLALALSRFPNIEIDIYEASAKFGEIGAGIVIFSRTWKLLMKLGLQDLEKIVPEAPRDDEGCTWTLILGGC